MDAFPGDAEIKKTELLVELPAAEHVLLFYLRVVTVPGGPLYGTSLVSSPLGSVFAPPVLLLLGVFDLGGPTG